MVNAHGLPLPTDPQKNEKCAIRMNFFSLFSLFFSFSLFFLLFLLRKNEVKKWKSKKTLEVFGAHKLLSGCYSEYRRTSWFYGTKVK